MNALHNLTIKKFHDGLLKKEFSALEITQAYFAHIEKTDGEIGAYLNVMTDEALRTAETVDLAIARKESVAPLAGVPIAIKDNILIEGFPATAGSKILESHIASYDAGVIKKLKKANAVFLGKTNLDEFAMGSSTENSAFKVTRNPHDTTRVPGGSSGGSAAAVAGHMALAALGSDTGGSIRQPAAFCGVVGLRPTYGSVSRSGLIAMASSLDQIGPFAKTVHDASLLFLGLAGHDEMDSTSSLHNFEAEREEILNPSLEKLRGLTVGIPKEYFVEGLNDSVARGVQGAIETVKKLGITVKEISLPNTKYAVSCYYVVVPAEVSSNLARFDGIRYSRNKKQETNHRTVKELYFETRGAGFGAESKRRIILGTFVLSSGYHDAYYKKAQAVRALIGRDFENAFKDVDVILAPVTPTPAFKIGEHSDDPLAMYLADIFTIPANLAGLPSISIPVAKTTNNEQGAKNLPVGFQLIGKHFHEKDILGIGQLYEHVLENKPL